MVLIPNSGRPGPIYNDAAAQTSAAPSNTTYLLASNNLSDLTNVLQARLNLGLGTAATSSSAAFDPAGAAIAAQNAAEAYARSLLSGIPSGTGSVTSVSVTTANGVSGVVATPTTTPAITLTLGAITPTTVNGITLTTGTGTLTLGTATLNAGTGGTLGPGAFASSSTGSGAVVLQTSPTLITPTFSGATLLGTTVLSSLTSNGFVKTTGGTGTLAVDTNTYQPLATNLTTLAALANPGVSGYVLSSTTGGVYSWVANGASSGFPITLGSTSIAAGSTTTSVNGLTIGATVPAAGTFTTLIGQLTEGVQATNSAATVFYGQNTTSGTAAATKFGLANSSQQLVFYITDTAYTGAPIVTGGVAKSATIFTDSSIPLILGTNGAANVTIASGGAVTLTSLAAATSGVVQSSTAGLLSALAYTGSTSNYLRADGTWATPAAASTPPASAVLISDASSTVVANLNDYNVQAYGASPSSPAATNVTAINAAILDMNTAGGGRLVFPGVGTYNVNAAIRVITVPCEIVGMGWLVTIIAQSAIQNIFTLNTTQPCYVHNIGLQGPGNASNCQGIQVSTNAQINSSTFINNCEITSFLAGITAPNTQNQFTISNCTIGCGHCIVIGGYVNVGVGLTVGPSTGAAAIISKCNLASPAANGVLAYAANGLVIEGCQIVSCTTGLRFTLQKFTGLSDLWFYGNHVECTNGIIFDGATNSVTSAQAFYNCVIVGNEFGVSGAGITTGTYATQWWLEQIVITGNLFMNCPVSPYCIGLYGTITASITGNVFQTNGTGPQVFIDSSCNFIRGLEYNTYVGGAGGGTAYTDNQTHTVATLQHPTILKGSRTFVTDATSTLSAGIGTTVTGGGTNVVPVFSNGLNWIIG